MEHIEKLNTVQFLLPFLTLACWIYYGLRQKTITPGWGAVLLGTMVLLPHILAFFKAYQYGDTHASIVIGVFMSFWLTLVIGLTHISYACSQKEMAERKHAFEKVLAYVEGPMVIIIWTMAAIYMKKSTALGWILITLGFTVFWLWIQKLFILAGKEGSGMNTFAVNMTKPVLALLSIHVVIVWWNQLGLI